MMGDQHWSDIEDKIKENEEITRGGKDRIFGGSHSNKKRQNHRMGAGKSAGAIGQGQRQARVQNEDDVLLQLKSTKKSEGTHETYQDFAEGRKGGDGTF